MSQPHSSAATGGDASPLPAPELAPPDPSPAPAGAGAWIKARWLALAAGAVGAGLGVAYALTIGCATGGCPITSSPWLSGGFGALLGYTLVRDLRFGKRSAATGDAEPAAPEGGTP